MSIPGKVRLRKTVQSITIAAILIVAVSGCGSKPDLVGHWEGSLDLSSVKGSPGVPESGKLKIVLEIKKSGSAYSGTLISPDQSPQPINMDSVTQKEDAVSVQVNQLSVSFDGKIGPDNNTLTGQFKQGAGSFPLTLKRINVPGSLAE